MSRLKDKVKMVTFVKMVTINVIVVTKIVDFIESSIRKIKGSEIEGIVGLHIPLPQGNLFPEIYL